MATIPVPDYKIGDLISFNKDREATHVIVGLNYFNNPRPDLEKSVLYSFEAIYLKNGKRRKFYVDEDIRQCWNDGMVNPVGHNPTMRLLYGKEES